MSGSNQLTAVIAVICSIFACAYSEKLINLGQQKGFWQGDIQRKPRQRNGILKTKRWTNGTIPYWIDTTNYSLKHIDMIDDAMRTIERSTCIRFILRTNELNYLAIFNGDGCNSQEIGMKGGKHEVSLQASNNKTCFNHFTIVHELLHVVGLNHEQMRHDRDKYITIQAENLLDPEKISQFNIAASEENNDYNISYNYASVMHYDAWGFGNGSIVMKPKDPSMLSVMGFVLTANETDFEKVRRIYDCKETYTPAPISASCEDYDTELCLRFAQNCSTERFMNERCRKTCGFCEWGKTSEPHTAYPWCEDWKNGCDSIRDCELPKQARYCQYTCGICDKSKTSGPTTLNPILTTNVYCEDRIADCDRSDCGLSPWMKNVCPYTCGFCDTTKTRTPLPVCQDQLPNCDKDKCDDWNNGIALRCRLTCGLCDGTATPRNEVKDEEESLI